MEFEDSLFGFDVNFLTQYIDGLLTSVELTEIGENAGELKGNLNHFVHLLTSMLI